MSKLGTPRKNTPKGKVLGLRAFEKISAVEGIHVSRELRSDLENLESMQMSASERSRFIRGKYGKKSA